MNRPATLPAWLAYLETLHPRAIALGLDRVEAVRAKMGVRLDCPVITVTGTNGKGSTCAMLEAVLRSAGYRTGLYMSPHLLHYNERVRIAGEPQADAALVAAFNAVEDARGDVALTYFEYGTLAALHAFARAGLDVAILEVGLGGRLDAVNIVDADVAVVTTIDLDHMDYLGPTRAAIACEKAGIFRAGRPVVCAEPDPPSTLIDHARAIGAPVALIGRDFGYVDEDRQWRYWGPGGERYGLPVPALRGTYQLANAATVLAVAGLLQDRLHVAAGAIRDGLCAVSLPGRFQVLPGRPAIVLDVAHNPHAARALAATLGTMGYFPATIAVFGVLADKDVRGVIDSVKSRIDRWYVATLPGPRGAAAAAVHAELLRAGIAPLAIRTFDDVDSAFAAARGEVVETDRIIVFGSFLTVAAALAAADSREPVAMAERIADNAEHLVDEMKRKARRRLVGAIVLALGAAIVLPLLLEKEPRPLGDDVSVQIPPIDENKFVNRLTGKAGESKALPKAESKVESKASAPPAKTEAPAAAAATTGAADAPVPKADAAAPKADVPAPKADATAAPNADAAMPKAAPTTAPKVDPKPVIAAASPAPAATPAPASAPATATTAAATATASTSASSANAQGAAPAKAEGFVVQLAAFADDKGANSLANKLKKNGYAAYVQPVETSRGTLWRVRVGGYATRPEADAARATLKGEGYSGITAPAQ